MKKIRTVLCLLLAILFSVFLISCAKTTETNNKNNATKEVDLNGKKVKKY